MKPGHPDKQLVSLSSKDNMFAMSVAKHNRTYFPSPSGAH